MFSPSLDDMIPQDHPVRLFDEILGGLDWSVWESCYVLVAGQPPIHPRVVAGAILYGMSQGIRSSRRLEWACQNALDFLWLVEGRTIDHSTFCQFRTRFAQELKNLFRQIGRVAMGMGMIRLNQVALDGTRIRANSSRHGQATVKTLQERLAELDAAVDQMFEEARLSDAADQDLFGEEGTPNRLPRDLADLKRRQERLRKALEAARAKEQSRIAAQPTKEAPPVRVPVADPESTIQPNKDGGFAPNYTPLVATDGQMGLIVAADVIANSAEGAHTVPIVDQVQENLGHKPEQVLADSAHGSGPNLAALAQREVEAYIPQENRQDGPDNPARREDPRQPVPPEAWDKLPTDPRHKGRLDRSAFVYEAATDRYYCPMGKAMGLHSVHAGRGKDRQTPYRRYECHECHGCPLGNRCLGPKGTYRSICRDEHEELRQAMDEKLRGTEGRQVYRRRRWIAETPFAFLKAWMGLRQFLLRGLEKVKTEWLWACSAYNLRKLARAMATRRAATAAKIA